MTTVKSRRNILPVNFVKSHKTRMVSLKSFKMQANIIKFYLLYLFLAMINNEMILYDSVEARQTTCPALGIR